jgi:hypothetical protein
VALQPAVASAQARSTAAIAATAPARPPASRPQRGRAAAEERRAIDHGRSMASKHTGSAPGAPRSPPARPAPAALTGRYPDAGRHSPRSYAAREVSITSSARASP